MCMAKLNFWVDIRQTMHQAAVQKLNYSPHLMPTNFVQQFQLHVLACSERLNIEHTKVLPDAKALAYFRELFLSGISPAAFGI